MRERGGRIAEEERKDGRQEIEGGGINGRRRKNEARQEVKGGEGRKGGTRWREEEEM